MLINDIQDQLVEEFELMDDWMEKYEHIIHMGNELPPMDETLKTDNRLIRGCQSRVWLDAKEQNGILHFEADSDALITKGLISMVVRVLNNQPAKDIAAADLYFVDKIGLRSHLSSNRANGLASMIQQIKALAVHFNSAN
ncbi:SufE family protein [Deminuibacter soli]|uniref:SufE family protein n=1 Tax=Deminuibacter soli TaxID=2291815 RepID=A0A3E1NI51_9BACT|nr:SufE family protein [Deminuibacter soli]RFM27610.1 SufE family protein [Deminuibacter soli]